MPVFPDYVGTFSKSQPPSLTNRHPFWFLIKVPQATTRRYWVKKGPFWGVRHKWDLGTPKKSTFLAFRNPRAFSIEFGPYTPIFSVF